MYAPLVTREGAAEATPPGDLELDSLFAGRYQVEALLGRGGMGVVYRVKDRLVDERVALKLLDLSRSDQSDAVDMFRREVRLARRITHPNVVRVHDLDEHSGRLFLTMEYVTGTDFRRELERAPGRLPYARAARVGLEIADALAAAHDLGIVHRDLKPENVLVERTGRLVLTDFGIAHLQDPRASARGAEALIGTPAYMAPEQVEGAASGPRADLYALGTLLFEALTGRLPFVRDGVLAMLVARVQEAPPDIAELCELPPAFSKLVMRCLARDETSRPASAADVAAELEAMLAPLGPDSGRSAGQSDESGRPPARTTRPTRSRSVAIPFAGGRRAIAVMPFRFQGPAEHDYLGEALAGELIDTLSRTKGMRVLAAASAARAADASDPRVIAEQLEVDYLALGTVQLAGPRLRVTVRLLDAGGEQLTSDRFDLGFHDLFEVQEQVGRRIAETLRLEVNTRALGVAAPQEAIDLYLRARTTLRRQQYQHAAGAVEMLERALELAPGFTPAIAALALATLHVWFLPSGAPARDWAAAARRAVARAVEVAPDLSESFVAAARLASHQGQLKEAVDALRRAIDLAPTAPEPQFLLGQLECETGRLDQGVARLALAFQVETAIIYPYEAARACALAGDHAGFDRFMAIAKNLDNGLSVLHLTLRQAAWTRDLRRLSEVVDRAAAMGPPFAPVFDVVAKSFLGLNDPALVVAQMSPVLGLVNPRFGGLLRQVLVEVFAHHGDVAGAIEWLEETHATVLYDVAWLERCPLLIPLHPHPAFRKILQAVRARCDGVWAR